MRSTVAPSGTVTFWFSDIEGSTQRWERDPTAMETALRRHDAIVRAAIEEHAGYVFKTIGDAFCAAFERPDSAAAAALAAHRNLASDDFSAVGGLRIRIALHAGTADERGGDYFGPTVNRVARLLAVAWGGQTVVSAAVAELIRGTLAPEATLRDLGEHRLKDLAEPERVSQLVVPDLASDFPALRSLDVTRHNLPVQLLPLIGREEVVATIEAALAEAPLVTIAGSGGIGKTRTSLQVAADVLERFADGVWYVELAPASDAAGVAGQLLAGLGLRETPGRETLDSVLLWLAPRTALTVLDNCEHVIAEAAHMSAAILGRCPHVRILATSREPLGTQGERVVRIPTLRVPPRGALRAEDALQFEAVALFCERARAVDSRFELTDRQAEIVGDVCRRLDGIALAIELAASRLKILSPAQLASKLDERFRLLTGGRREAIPRQATLHAMIAWSYDLLDERERRVFERLSVFMDACPIEAAIEVCGDDESDEFETLDALEALANKSLLAVEGESDEKRYRLLESTRAFASLKLRERGGEFAARARHARYAATVAKSLDASVGARTTADWEAGANEAAADLRAALSWAIDEANDERLGIELVADMRWFWSAVAAAEGRSQIRRSIEIAERMGAEPEVLAKLEIGHANLALMFADYPDQLRAAIRARTLLEAGGNPSEGATAARLYSQALHLIGRAEEALPPLEAAIAQFCAIDSKRDLALAYDNRASLRRDLGDLAGAHHDSKEAIDLAAAGGWERILLGLEINAGEIEFARGDASAAIALVERAMDRSYATHEPALFAFGWSNLATYYGAAGRYEESVRSAHISLGFSAQAGIMSSAAFALQTIAGARAAQGDAETAATLLGFVDARLSEANVEREATERLQREAILTLILERCGDERTSHLRQAGAALTFEAATRLAR